ncbi:MULTISPECIES: redox-sensitive transcriptional activator SoxR [Streptomyces]|uniref:redox-sensitive transcriptional activator SoxR n=1 Tax=Streptomyces TaxID=1883 RepID=UPI00025CE541|nr:redox-sensitive transcriptional activator SoxR [Streptomyces tsukubensis]AZK93342.1 redox-sensitive transcriptional activator SoxR [Streptomyces tsukubensis]EIF88898.1 transcriptional regulator, MerR family protein [Streptomyces tsukubensis NRRL18488]
MPPPTDTISELTVGQLSQRSGAAVSALHFYESKGLIHSRRTSGNQRRYSRDTLRRVAFVRAAQRVGIPLSTIRDALAELPEERTPDREDWASLSRTWRRELDQRIKQLGRLRDTLTECIGCGCLSLETCALSNPEDAFGRQRPGSRLMPGPLWAAEDAKDASGPCDGGAAGDKASGPCESAEAQTAPDGRDGAG